MYIYPNKQRCYLNNINKNKSYYTLYDQIYAQTLMKLFQRGTFDVVESGEDERTSNWLCLRTILIWI